MRFKTLEIRWHDSKPISTCDFQPVPWKKARPPPGQEKNYASQSYKLATGGEDNHVRIWMVYPNILATSVLQEHADASGSNVNLTSRPPRIEYLATLSKHSAAVNVVRFSPNGELIASSGDDGMIIIWASSSHPQGTAYGSDITAEELQYEREFWRPRTTFRCTSMQVYDLAWSPSGEYIIAGSTDNVARIFTTVDGRCVHEIAEHSHFVQGVAWDPLNEYVATQSSDRSMHIYNISTKQGSLEVHAIGKNSRLVHQHTRTPSSQSRPRHLRSQSVASDVESVTSEMRDEVQSQASRDRDQAPLTPSTSVASTPSVMFPPPPQMVDKPSSRRSSFSSNAPGSPPNLGRYGRSPSPMPALPAIRTPSPWSTIKLYGDENFTNFFRRLSFSPDGGLLLTPAGQFEDQSVVPGSSKPKAEDQPTRGRKGRLSVSTNDPPNPTPASSVFIYTRANFARPPIAQLPGHKKASIAVRFSPVLYELRPNVLGAEGIDKKHTTAYGVLEKGKDSTLDVDVTGPSATVTGPSCMLPSQAQTPVLAPQGVAVPAPMSPVLSPIDARPPTPAASKPPTPHSTPSRRSQQPATPATGSVFALPYRMLFAVATMDTVAIYDTQQSGPLCLLTKLHYDEFTDMCWSPDGQSLLLSSRDGYCTVVIFDDIIPAYQTQQHTLQLQSIAQHHSMPITVGPTPTVANNNNPKKRSDPPLTPAPSIENDLSSAAEPTEDRPKKKRRVALTRVGDLDA